MKNTPIQTPHHPCFVKTGMLPKTRWDRISVANALRNLRKHAKVKCKKEENCRIYFAEASWSVRVYFVPSIS